MRQNVQAHGDATKHAWLWVYGKDGTIYWIDPTWTDSTGYAWWGVVENGREVQRNAIQRLSAVKLSTNDNARALINSGDANLKQKRYEKAIADYNQAIWLKPDYVAAYHKRGLAYFMKGDYQQAAADFEEAEKKVR